MSASRRRWCRVEQGGFGFIHAQTRGQGSLLSLALQPAGADSFQLTVQGPDGATVFATAGSAEKVEACRALGAHHAIDYSTEDFVQAVWASFFTDEDIPHFESEEALVAYLESLK